VESTPAKRSVMSIARASVRQLRPKQWTKNAFLFAALVFSGEFLSAESLQLSLQGFFAFCFVSSSGYILNDYLDREADRRHPKKCKRPIASGALPEAVAAVLFFATFFGGLFLAYSLSKAFLWVTIAYLVTTLSYSFFFKHLVILDVMVLALCFVWRAVAGAVAIVVPASPWLFLCTGFLALFLGFHKRRAELVQLGAVKETRKSLRKYTAKMLEQYQAMVMSATVLSYALYTLTSEANTGLVLTVPWVLYGLFRYIYLVEHKGAGDAPDETLLKDAPLFLTAVGYVLTAMFVLWVGQLADPPELLRVLTSW